MRSRRLASSLVAGGLALALVACTQVTSGDPPTGARTPPSPIPEPEPGPTGASTGTSTGTPDTRARPVTIALAGDVHFEGALRRRLADPATALAPATRALAAADVAILNLETSLGSGGRPEPGKRYTFQAPPSALRALTAAGVDVASQANNHALDFGRAPLPGALAAIAAARSADPPLAVVGLGRDADEAFRPARTLVGDTVVATIAATVAGEDPTADPTGQWAATASSPGTADAVDPARLLRAVGAADRTADVVVAYLHWGIQGDSCPTDDQRSLAADLVAAGADVVAGSHAHRLQGDGRLGAGYVAYGLGNYAWYTQDAEPTGVLTLTVRPGRTRAGRARVVSAQWQPARIGPDGLPAALAPSDRPAFEADREALRRCAGLTP
ncbi:CapA family protein [Nocardioides sp. cx-173]|uniref:CapA family protein n=1 Tax=Nocardioides sp. cx-173 TaxID=2898796 RepID=UPI001E444A54|nr:CapA family protein [Nocardioides sp. cx-173]MCD4523549.1 CapA family protein [Nocardioides sp. cx-173]UGB42113.1 CapA family protein [Nocardioides sp. cx-173]